MNEEKNKEKILAGVDALGELETFVANVHTKIQQDQRSVFVRYPLTFSLLGTLGIAAVIHGFEGTVDAVPFLADRPILIFCVGLLVLFSTGGLYKYLRK